MPATPPIEREEQRLRLQRMETKLLMALFDHPGLVDRRTEHRLRYAIGLASIDVFQPGAAANGGRTHHPDIPVRLPELSRWRRRVLDRLGKPIFHISSSRRRIESAAKALQPLLGQLESTRTAVLEKYAQDFSEQHLDQEIGIKTLVTVAGGGGGSGYVYLGAWDVLQQAGLVPGYVIGSSMGSVVGLFRALQKQADFVESVGFAKRVKAEDVFRFASIKARYGLPGLMRLFLHEAFGEVIRGSGGRELLLPDLEIPYEAVVAGVRRRAGAETIEEYALSHHYTDKRPGALQLRAQIAARLVRLAGFVNPRAVQEIVVGGDALTRHFNAIDAAGFSAAIPGILHYDVTRDDPHMNEILPELMDRENVIALVDGGVANNVPARSAWRQVQRGKVGTRNCYYLAFDSFHPQLGWGHFWLQPVTRIVAYQVALQERYAQRRVEFRPTLSPLNLLPTPGELDIAVAWGRQQMAEELPRIQKFFERVRWEPLSRAEAAA